MPVTVNIHLQGLGETYQAEVRTYSGSSTTEPFASIELTPSPNAAAIMVSTVAQCDLLADAIMRARRYLRGAQS